MDEVKVEETLIDQALVDLEKSAGASGYYLNPDTETTRELVRGLLVNEERYGYRACPCRLATGELMSDRDIICPCEYRDEDVEQFNTCYCSLYVSKDAAEAQVEIGSIPERRKARLERKENLTQRNVELSGFLSGAMAYPIWRCKVCGYLCALNEPPKFCPICKAKQALFERFL